MNAIFITVRSGSKRLPQKCFKKIGGRATIELLIDRVKQSRRADTIVLCTTSLPEDEALSMVSFWNGINCYRGSVEDKLARWQGAAHEYGVDFFVTADGDDLLCDPELIDLAFEQHERTGADFIKADGLVCGAFTYGIKTSALDRVCEIKGTTETEMMAGYFTDTGLFKVEELDGVPDEYRRPEIRMTLDYEDDLSFFKKVFGHFKGQGFNLSDIIHYLDKHPAVVQINQYLQAQFLENQRRNTRMVIRV
jgi:spore coat polysaccharide biosynthesis protein SpsF